MTTKAPPKILPRTDYYALLGLLHLAAGHHEAIVTIEKAVCGLLGESVDAAGHASDAVWSPGYRPVDEMLALLGFEVAKEES